MSAGPDFPYSRLPGTFRGFIRRASLWAGPDHLLSVTGTRFVEEYRRFYYRDIQAIVIQKCPRAGSIGIWVVLGFICFVATIQASTAVRAPIAGPVALATGLFLLVRLVLSLRYSCRCYIQTAVSREELPSLLRPWIAEKALTRLRAKINDAQGVLPEEIGSVRRDSAAASPAIETLAPAVPDSISGTANSPQREEEPGPAGLKWALAAFMLLLVDAAQSFWFLDAPARLTNSTGMRVLTILLVLAQLGTMVTALLQVHNFRALRPVRNALLIGLAFLGVEAWFSRYFRQVFLVETAAFHVQASFIYVWHWVQVTAGILALLIGTVGLILILLNWESYRRGHLSTA
jgi:hypothetical protein